LEISRAIFDSGELFDETSTPESWARATTEMPATKMLSNIRDGCSGKKVLVADGLRCNVTDTPES